MFIDATTTDDVSEFYDFGVVPPGFYRASIAGVQLKQSKSSDAQYIEFTFVGVADKVKGKKFWHICTVQSSNDVAVQIGHKSLKDVVFALGAKGIDTNNMPKFESWAIGKEAVLQIIIEKDKMKSGELRNKVKTVFHVSGKHRNAELKMEEPKKQVIESKEDVPF